MIKTRHACSVKIVINKRRARGDLSLKHIKARFAKDYIISLKCSFQILSGLKEHPRQLMAAATRQQFRGDTLNILYVRTRTFSGLERIITIHPRMLRRK
jgi:hypothetical protein